MPQKTSSSSDSTDYYQSLVESSGNFVKLIQDTVTKKILPDSMIKYIEVVSSNIKNDEISIQGNKLCTSEKAKLMVDEIMQKQSNKLTNLDKHFNSYLLSYKNLFNYQLTLESLVYNKKKELQKFSNKIDTYKQNLYIDERKDNYENSNYEFYKSINFYILLFYYSLIIIYFIFTPFFQEKKYLNYKLIIIIVLYIFFPFMLPYILSIIYNIYEYIIETNNLRGEIISYPYIIEDKEKYE